MYDLPLFNSCHELSSDKCLRLLFMAFERYHIRQFRTMQSHDKPICLYSLHPTFHSLHLIVIEPQMWGWALMANCGRGLRCWTLGTGTIWLHTGHSASSEATCSETVASDRETRADVRDRPTLATLPRTARHNLRHLLTGGVVRAKSTQFFHAQRKVEWLWYTSWYTMS